MSAEGWFKPSPFFSRKSESVSDCHFDAIVEEVSQGGIQDRIPFLGMAIISGIRDSNISGTQKLRLGKSAADLPDFSGDY